MSFMVIERPVGDLEPATLLRMRQGDGQLVPTDTAEEIILRLREVLTGRLAFERSFQPTDVDEDGWLAVIWEPGDPVQTRGLYRVTVTAEYPGDRPATVPTLEADKILLRVH